jgi:hypothetical protein
MLLLQVAATEGSSFVALHDSRLQFNPHQQLTLHAAPKVCSARQFETAVKHQKVSPKNN